MLGRLKARPLIAALVIAATALVELPAQSSVAHCASAVTGKDLWTRIQPPTFSSGGSGLRTYAIDPVDPGQLVTTNGDQVAVTKDGGCTWTLPSLPDAVALPGGLPLPENTIVSQSVSAVAMGFSAEKNAPVWAVGQSSVVTPNGLATQPRILLSSNGTSGFADKTSTFPERLGQMLAVATTGSNVALVLFRQSGVSPNTKAYVTVDGGLTWILVGQNLGDVSHVDLDIQHSMLLAWGKDGLYRVQAPTSSADAASAPTMAKVAGVPSGLGAVTTSLSGEITAFLAKGGARFSSTNGGVSFRKSSAPDQVDSASAGPMRGLMALSNVDVNVLVEPPADPAFRKIPPTNFSPNDVNVSDVHFVLDPTGQAGQFFNLYAFNPQALYRRVIPPSFFVPPPPPAPPVEVSSRRPALPKASVLPANQTIRLQQGQTRRVDYHVVVPPRPTPLDVFFMTDSTGSMSGTIASVQEGVQQIVDDLAAMGIDAEFGVADFRDYPEGAGLNDPENYPYKLRRTVGKINSELADALASLSTGGGTADGDDSALEAIYQAATGAGRVDPLLVRGNLIPPGLDAHFRSDALKVILVASDDEMRHPETNPGYPGPSRATVEQALQQAGIHFVGIEVHTTEASARTDMEALARATQTLAPPKGVDCDGDGQINKGSDVMGGQPIVCPFAPDSGDSIAPVFTGLLEGLRDYGPVDLRVDSDAAAVVKPLGQLHFPKVNLKAISRYTLPVQFTCDAAHAGTTTTATIVAASRGADVASTDATVVCAPAAKPPVPPVAPFVVAPVAIAAAVPPPPAPQAPGPNPNPNPNPQVNANAGAATNEEDQAQLALAEGDQGEEISESDEVAFSARRSEPPVPLPDLAWIGAVMLMSAAAFGTHLARRNNAWGQIRTQESR